MRGAKSRPLDAAVEPQAVGALELRQLPLRAIDRLLRIDPQDLNSLCVGLVELPELRQIGGQEDVTLHPAEKPCPSRSLDRDGQVITKVGCGDRI